MAHQHKINIIILVGLTACILIVLWGLNIDKKSNKPQINLSKRTVVTDLAFTESLNNKKVFSFKIGSIKVLRKKIEFLRFGLYKIARIENMCVNFYNMDKFKQDPCKRPLKAFRLYFLKAI